MKTMLSLFTCPVGLQPLPVLIPIFCQFPKISMQMSLFETRESLSIFLQSWVLLLDDIYNPTETSHDLN
jgi:hypothetical protein